MFRQAVLTVVACLLAVGYARVVPNSNAGQEVMVVVELMSYNNPAGKLFNGEACLSAPLCDPKFSGYISDNVPEAESAFMTFNIPVTRVVDSISFHHFPAERRRFEFRSVVGKNLTVTIGANDDNLVDSGDVGDGTHYYSYPLIGTFRFRYQVGTGDVSVVDESGSAMFVVLFKTIPIQHSH